ncbi:MAG: tRNA pseudouridine(55) synthase TruB [Deltaproteobacteria bacterium]|nr:tRNA pseudouridine(55) synthase TruB [Deltaproteobacteria bacterium]
MRRRRPAPRFTVSGVLVVDKPAGPTSHDVVDELRRRFRPAKLGHAGTLDPFATGVLVLLFNQATRLAEIMGQGGKTYLGRLELGRAMDTGDPTGRVTAEVPVPELDEARILAALASLEGEQEQAPPAYSAVKHQGRPLYAYAREGQAVTKPARPITVAANRLLAWEPGWVLFETRCSKGTYLRVLAEDLARRLGTVGHLSALTRAVSLPFSLDDAVELERVLAWDDDELTHRLLDPDQALARAGLPAVVLPEEAAWQIRQGRILPREIFLSANPDTPLTGAFRVTTPGGELVAVLNWLAAPEGDAGRDYETVRVFSEPSRSQEEEQPSASAMGAE